MLFSIFPYQSKLINGSIIDMQRKKAFLSRFFPPEMLFVAFSVCTYGSNRPLLLIIVYPNEGGVAGYGNRMKAKYTAKWGLQIVKMIFQTRSSNLKAPKSMIFCPLVSLYCIWIVQEKCSKKCQRHIDSRLPFSFSHFIFLPTILSCNFPGYKPYHISKTCT